MGESSNAIWLNVMHVAAAIPIVGMLAVWLPAIKDADQPQVAI